MSGSPRVYEGWEVQECSSPSVIRLEKQSIVLRPGLVISRPKPCQLHAASAHCEVQRAVVPNYERVQRVLRWWLNASAVGRAVESPPTLRIGNDEMLVHQP